MTNTGQKMSKFAALENFLDSEEADGGIRTIKARQLVCIAELYLDGDDTIRF